jgi:predicted ATPase
MIQAYKNSWPNAPPRGPAGVRLGLRPRQPSICASAASAFSSQKGISIAQHGWGSKTYYAQLHLDPLPPESAEALLQALVGDDPSLAPLARTLVERTEGNPFFLEESVRTLVETGVLAGERGAYRLAKRLETARVPATVQAVLAARIDRLAPEDKRLLQAAAVVGKDVPYPLLQAVAERTCRRQL